MAPLVTANAVNAAAAAATNGSATVDTISGVREREPSRGRLWWWRACVGDDCGDFDTSLTLRTHSRLFSVINFRALSLVISLY